MTFDIKYQSRDLYICFPAGDEWFLYPHDAMLKQILASTEMGKTKSWKRGQFHYPTISRERRMMLEPYRLVAKPARGVEPLQEDRRSRGRT